MIQREEKVCYRGKGFDIGEGNEIASDRRREERGSDKRNLGLLQLGQPDWALMKSAEDRVIELGLVFSLKPKSFVRLLDKVVITTLTATSSSSRDLIKNRESAIRAERGSQRNNQREQDLPETIDRKRSRSVSGDVVIAGSDYRVCISEIIDQARNYQQFERRPILKSSKAPPPAVKWIKDWVPQDIVATGAKCYLRKWVTEEAVKRLKEKEKEPTTTNTDVSDPDPEPTSEILFLCSYDGCGKIFFDVSALRKHSHIHGERQYVCHYPGCDKKFVDSSKLKRHWLIHTGARDFVCTYQGCGKAFSLDFNLRSHMKTHSQENYHICPYSGCGKRYAHEYKLKNHVAVYHEKNAAGETPTTYTPPAEKVSRTPKTPAATVYGSASLERPYTCPYEGCDKAYMHEYKLKLHLKREHLPEENNNTPNKHDQEEGSDQDLHRKHASNGKSQIHRQQGRAKPNMRRPPAKALKKGSTSSPAKARMAKKPWQVKETFEGGREEDSEETEEDREDVDDGLRFGGKNEEEDDDEETEDED
ncbi:hypothetical protein Bca101_017236 [Brassica carinata]